jgi:hypothetical protein
VKSQQGQTTDLRLSDSLLVHHVPDTATAITLSVTYESQDSDLLLQAGSVDQTGNYVFDVEPTGALSTSSKPIRYWTADGPFDTMVSFYNTSATDAVVNLTLFFNETGRYVIPIHLKGNGQLELNIGDYVRRQQPDAEGMSYL